MTKTSYLDANLELNGMRHFVFGMLGRKLFKKYFHFLGFLAVKRRVDSNRPPQLTCKLTCFRSCDLKLLTEMG